MLDEFGTLASIERRRIEIARQWHQIEPPIVGIECVGCRPPRKPLQIVVHRRDKGAVFGNHLGFAVMASEEVEAFFSGLLLVVFEGQSVSGGQATHGGMRGVNEFSSALGNLAGKHPAQRGHPPTHCGTRFI